MIQYVVRVSPNLQVSYVPRMWRPYPHTSTSGQWSLTRGVKTLHYKQKRRILGIKIINLNARGVEDLGSITGRGTMPLPSTWPRHARRGNRKR